ncbi:glycoside hydrolase family 3 N-terminal domain-containing protein [Soonwooa sp.]|uniref:glycoside hydrolase family 3 protein n=1 Tax=Soonwooa sp. TaxID=1938592 RepID=UPI0026215559|nr:glycoside hydrolase family 3 N-terminal domain-containing protein [Soonwooa sp.]
MKRLILAATIFGSIFNKAQYIPKNISPEETKAAHDWVDKTYNQLSEDQKLGQLFIVALYTNKGIDHIQEIRNLVTKEQIGGLILMQDDAAMEINLVNEFQSRSKVPMMIGMDAEWGLFQRIAKAYKFPWAITLGAIQDQKLVYNMAAQIAADCKRMGINWDFAPVVDVNTNPSNPIIGNRSFGSDVNNVIAKARAYAFGLQDNQILAAVKHFPGHGDTSADSHYDLPLVEHNISRLEEVELAPYKTLLKEGIGGVMVAHLYVPALEKEKNVPASISKNIITDLLKNKLGYKGLIITDALNMGAVANRYQPGQLDALAFKAGNDIMLFSQGVKEGKRLIAEGIAKGDISKDRLEESVKKILLTKYYLGLNKYENKNPDNVIADLNNASHQQLVQNLYENALTLLKDKNNLLPLDSSQEKIYYLPLEEASYSTFQIELWNQINLSVIKPSDVAKLPKNSKILIGLHKDNSTAYKSYKISDASKKIIEEAAKQNKIILTVFGSPYALKDLDTSNISTIVVAYENNADSQKAAVNGITGETKISGRLPVLVNDTWKYGDGIDL